MLEYLKQGQQDSPWMEMNLKICGEERFGKEKSGKEKNKLD